MKCCLYRHYDQHNRLLYVGASLHVFARQLKHKTNAQWFGDIARIDIEHLPDKTTLLAAESKAIFDEKPAHNIYKQDKNERGNNSGTLHHPESLLTTSNAEAHKMAMINYKPAENLDDLPKEAIVRWPTINRVFPVSKTHWDVGVKEGRYPKPISIGKRGKGWRWGVILNMLKDLENAEGEA